MPLVKSFVDLTEKRVSAGFYLIAAVGSGVVRERSPLDASWSSSLGPPKTLDYDTTSLLDRECGDSGILLQVSRGGMR